MVGSTARTGAPRWRQRDRGGSSRRGRALDAPTKGGRRLCCHVQRSSGDGRPNGSRFPAKHNREGGVEAGRKQRGRGPEFEFCFWGKINLSWFLLFCLFRFLFFPFFGIIILIILLIIIINIMTISIIIMIINILIIRIITKFSRRRYSFSCSPF